MGKGKNKKENLLNQITKVMLAVATLISAIAQLIQALK